MEEGLQDKPPVARGCFITKIVFVM